jgi:structural maintenance of chromosome 4
MSVLITLFDVSIVLQTLSSLALVFALHHYKPTPLYVMDEIDAALGKSCETFFLNIFRHFKIFMHLFLTDFKNVSIVGHYVKDRTKDAQFIIIRYITSSLAFQLLLLPLFHTISR